MTAAPNVPDWLKLRDGGIKPGVRPETCFVMVGGQPLYKLEVRPTTGKYACAVTHTVNGKRVDDAKVSYTTAADAVAGGLEQLRNALGW